MSRRGEKTLQVLGAIEEANFPLALAGLLHRAEDASTAEEVGRRFRLTNKHVERASWLLANRHRLESATTVRWPKLQRLLIAPGIADLLALHAAVSGDVDSPELAAIAASGSRFRPRNSIRVRWSPATT